MKKLMSIEKSDYVNKKHIDKCDYANYNVRIATNKRRRKRGEIDECGERSENIFGKHRNRNCFSKW